MPLKFARQAQVLLEVKRWKAIEFSGPKALKGVLSKVSIKIFCR